MSWRVAASLDQLLAEINAAAPGRNKASDGSIGDESHSARESDHNPCTEHGENPGVVCARDFTHDPPDFDAHAFARWLAPRMASGAETRCKYIISNRQIASASSSPPWSWRTYDGSNPHTNHVHVSVAHPSTLYDDDRSWGYGSSSTADKGDWLDMASLDDVKNAVRAVLNEGTAKGQQNWAGTSKAQLGTEQQNYNLLVSVKGTVEGLAENAGTRIAPVADEPPVVE